MKMLVWVFGALLALSFVFPNGLDGVLVRPEPQPLMAVVAGADAEPEIVKLLTGADTADKIRIYDVYTGLITVLNRDAGKRVSTTEKLAELQENTLQLAIDKPGKYPGLDEAIERVFLAAVGTDDVMPGNPAVRNKLIEA